MQLGDLIGIALERMRKVMADADVLERRQLRQRLHKAQEARERLDRLTRRDRLHLTFLPAAHHVVRQPLGITQELQRNRERHTIDDRRARRKERSFIRMPACCEERVVARELRDRHACALGRVLDAQRLLIIEIDTD